MIKSFAHKGLEQFFLAGTKAGIQPLHANRIRLILAQLQQARTIEDLRIPTLRIHELLGDRKGIGQSPYKPTGASRFNFRRVMPKLWITRIITED